MRSIQRNWCSSGEARWINTWTGLVHGIDSRPGMNKRGIEYVLESMVEVQKSVVLRREQHPFPRDKTSQSTVYSVGMMKPTRTHLIY